MSNSVIGHIFDVYFSLTPGERKVADFVLENSQKFPYMTAIEISQAAGVSEPTIFRMCKALGFDGLQEFRLVLASAIDPDHQREEKSELKDEESDMRAFVNSSFTSLFSSCDATYHMLDFNLLEKVVELLEKANKICLFGVSSSYLSCLDAQRKLLRMKMNAYAFDCSYDAMSLVGKMDKNDVLIIASYSGRTNDAQNVIHVGAMQGVNTILLTSYPKSPCAKYADIILKTYSSEMLYVRSGIASRYSQSVVFDAVYMMLIWKMDPALQDTIQQSNMRNVQIHLADKD